MNVVQSSSQYRTLDTIGGEPMEFEWDVFPGFTTLQLCNKVQEFMSKMGESMAREMGSPRRGSNRRRRTREGAGPACVQTPTLGVAHTREGRAN